MSYSYFTFAYNNMKLYQMEINGTCLSSVTMEEVYVENLLDMRILPLPTFFLKLNKIFFRRKTDS